MLLFLLIIYLFCSGISARIVSNVKRCPDNERYYDSDWSPTCDRNCQDIARKCPPTTTEAVAGCYCKKGYGRNLQQQCILLYECRNDCFPNERPILPDLHGCENRCVQNESPVEQMCYEIGAAKCICATGYCRNDVGGCESENEKLI